MSKICTSIEQSKKLIELGLDVNTADMCWTNHLFNAFLSSNRIESTPPQEYKNLLDRFVVRGYFIEPAWSLSALLDVLPKYIGDYGKCLYFDMGYYYCGYMVDGDFMLSIEETVADNPIDAVFEMIIKLKELELL